MKHVKNITRRINIMVGHYIDNCEDVAADKQMFIDNRSHIADCFTETGYAIDQEFSAAEKDFFEQKTGMTIQNFLENQIAKTIIANY